MEDVNNNDILKLDNQLCFPLYVVSKEIIRKYKPYLEKLDLTYTQYIAMIVMWEKKNLKVTDLGKMLFLDTGTISPLIRKLKDKGYVTLSRSSKDERVQMIQITQKGEELKQKAVEAGLSMKKKMCACLDEKDMKELYRILYNIINNME